jgi:hypothetical protein
MSILDTVGISRNELVVMVASAATEAGVSSEVYEKLVAAALDDRHTLYAVGRYENRGVGCKCPANYAGLVEVRSDPETGDKFLAHTNEADGFPSHFDRLARKLVGSVGVLEVVND